MIYCRIRTGAKSIEADGCEKAREQAATARSGCRCKQHRALLIAANNSSCHFHVYFCLYCVRFVSFHLGSSLTMSARQAGATSLGMQSENFGYSRVRLRRIKKLQFGVVNPNELVRILVAF